MSAAVAASRPLLICLNLQRRHIDAHSRLYVPRAFEVISCIHSCLAWARRTSIPLIYIHTQSADCAGNPIAGCEPRSSEAVFFKRSASFLQSAEFIRDRDLQALDAFVVGFTTGRDCIAAAADAERLGARLLFVSDAIASSSIGDHDASVLDSVLSSVLGEFAALVPSSNLLALEVGQAGSAARLPASFSKGGSNDYT